ncbi:hypothetical protein [Saccharicrinis sp. GN24d3]|uniref:hypothetical protein n=1 Tax=Saccharicrinis sp. GN24d3 TaxID=3458416 RepID=UPI004034FF03
MYLLLAAVYIFGFGAYALNCKKNDCKLAEAAPKEINYKESSSNPEYSQQNDCYCWNQHQEETLIETEAQSKLKYDYHIFKNALKGKEHFCTLYCDIKFSLQIASRPPPFSV